jgi:hypothetical protein
MYLMSDHSQYLLVAKIREKLAKSKQMHTFHIQRYNHKKLNKVQGKQQYHIEITNRFAAL